MTLLRQSLEGVEFLEYILIVVSVSEVYRIVDRMMDSQVILASVRVVELLTLLSFLTCFLFAYLTQQYIFELLLLSSLSFFDCLIIIVLMIVIAAVLIPLMHEIQMPKAISLSGYLERTVVLQCLRIAYLALSLSQSLVQLIVVLLYFILYLLCRISIASVSCYLSTFGQVAYAVSIFVELLLIGTQHTIHYLLMLPQLQVLLGLQPVLVLELLVFFFLQGFQPINMLGQIILLTFNLMLLMLLLDSLNLHLFDQIVGECSFHQFLRLPCLSIVLIHSNFFLYFFTSS